VFAKVQPLLAELREMFQAPEAFSNLEKLIMSMPDGAERVKKTQEWLKTISAQIAEQQKGGDKKADEAAA
jgi:hypothetical protein